MLDLIQVCPKRDDRIVVDPADFKGHGAMLFSQKHNALQAY